MAVSKLVFSKKRKAAKKHGWFFASGLPPARSEGVDSNGFPCDLTPVGYPRRMQQTIECAHDLCNCTLTAEMETEEYCSPVCKDDETGGIESDACKCGHPPCDVQ